jgi:hypothetical protein
MPDEEILYDVLGPSNLVGWTISFVQLPNGDLFAVNYVQNSSTAITQSEIEFLAPGEDSIVDVTSEAVSGPLPANIGSMPLIDELYVGDNALPDLILPEGGPDQAPWSGGQVRVLAPNADGQYVDVTGELTQDTAYIHRASTGEINGQAAIVVDMVNNQVGNPAGIELLIANADGTFSNWSSHLPASYASMPDSANDVYTASAIGDFTGKGGDIFLGAERDIPNVLLENNGSGYFSAETINVATPTFADGGWGSAVYALATKFDGDTNEDLIVVYADSTYGGPNSNPTGNAYYLQFLKGDGHGGFTDVTAQDFPNQPKFIDGFGDNAWVEAIQPITLNGENDLILYLANGSPEILLDNGKGVYSLSPAQVYNNASVADYGPDLIGATWGVDNGVGGFFGYTNGNQWVFAPITTAYLNPTQSTLNQPLASHLYLYGDGAAAATAASLAQTYDTNISVTFDELYLPGTTHTVDLIVNGVDIGPQNVVENYGFTNNGQEFTPAETLTFRVPGLDSISSLQINEDSNNDVVNLYVADVNVDGVDLGNQTTWTSDHSQTVSASTWNAAINPAIGTASDPIDVVATGTGVTAYVLGDVADYTITGAFSSTIQLAESAGLNQNATLTNVAQVAFSDYTLVFDLHSSEDQLVYELYQAAYDRVPDNAGYRYWATVATANQMTPLQLADQFLAAPEFTQLYGANPTNLQYVTELYTNVLGRAPDQAGLNYWVGQANAGQPRDQLLIDFATSPENVSLIGPHIADGYWTTH